MTRISLSDHFFSSCWAALNEVPAAVAAAIGQGALDSPASHVARTDVLSTL